MYPGAARPELLRPGGRRCLRGGRFEHNRSSREGFFGKSGLAQPVKVTQLKVTHMSYKTGQGHAVRRFQLRILRRGSWGVLALALAITGVVSGGAARAAQAAETGSSAKVFIEGKHRELSEALKLSKNPRKDPKLIAIFDSILDYEALTMGSMGEHWGELNPAQQLEFRSLLKQLIQKSYRKNVKDTSRYSVNYSDEVTEAAGARVKTTIRDVKNTHEKPMNVDYLVAKVEGELRVRDIVTEEVSLVNNYRKQFAKLLKKRGADGMLAQMRKQLDEGN
jgi:phospholipid transport system substrate-binding protein